MDIAATIAALQTLLDAGHTHVPLVSEMSGEEMDLAFPCDGAEGEDPEILATWKR